MNSVCVFSKIPNLLKELRFQLPAVQFYEVLSDKDEKLKESEIIVADFHLLTSVLYDLPKTKWLQGTWAGVDTIMPSIDPNRPLPYTITRYSGKYFGRVMTEYVLSNIVNHERNFIETYNNQKSKIWSDEGKVIDYRVISDLNIGILGLGQIGSYIAEILHKFGATIFGYGRKPNLDENMRGFIKDYYTKSKLLEFLKNCDYMVNTMPNTKETKGLLNGNILQHCKERKAVFINVGRGSIISDDDLIRALNEGWLSAAILDVFNIEPLPESSPLWSMPQVRITPHVSAVSAARDIARQFKDNFELYRFKKPIPTTIDIVKGY